MDEKYETENDELINNYWMALDWSQILRNPQCAREIIGKRDMEPKIQDSDNLSSLYFSFLRPPRRGRLPPRGSHRSQRHDRARVLQVDRESDDLAPDLSLRPGTQCDLP